MQVAILKKMLDKLGRLVEELNLTAQIRSFVKLYRENLITLPTFTSATSSTGFQSGEGSTSRSPLWSDTAWLVLRRNT